MVSIICNQSESPMTGCHTGLYKHFLFPPELEESEVKIICIKNTDGLWMISMFIFSNVPRRPVLSMKEISTCQNTPIFNCIPVVVRNRLSNVKPLSKSRPSKSIRKLGRWVALIRIPSETKGVHFQCAHLNKTVQKY